MWPSADAWHGIERSQVRVPVSVVTNLCLFTLSGCVRGGRGVERGSARRSSLKGRERAIVNKMDIGTVSEAVLGKLLRDGMKRIWAFPSA